MLSSHFLEPLRLSCVLSLQLLNLGSQGYLFVANLGVLLYLQQVSLLFVQLSDMLTLSADDFLLLSYLLLPLI